MDTHCRIALQPSKHDSLKEADPTRCTLGVHVCASTSSVPGRSTRLLPAHVAIGVRTLALADAAGGRVKVPLTAAQVTYPSSDPWENLRLNPLVGRSSTKVQTRISNTLM